MISDKQVGLARMENFTKTHDLNEIYEEDSSEESLFRMQILSPKKYKKSQIILGKRLIGRCNYWKTTQMKLYIDFLKEFLDLFERSNKLRLRLRAFHLMSDFIKTKSYAQCRIYHFRMIRRFNTTERIIQAAEGRLHPHNSQNLKSFDYGGLKVCLDEMSEEQNQQIQGIWEVIGNREEEDRATEEPYSQFQ